MGGFREGTGALDPTGKSHVATRFLKNTGTDLYQEVIGPHCFLREVCTTLCEIRC